MMTQPQLEISTKEASLLAKVRGAFDASAALRAGTEVNPRLAAQYAGRTQNPKLLYQAQGAPRLEILHGSPPPAAPVRKAVGTVNPLYAQSGPVSMAHAAGQRAARMRLGM